MIRVDLSPILFYFYFFIRSELIRTGSPKLIWSDFWYLPDSEAYMLQVDSKNVTDIWSIDINTKTDKEKES